MTEEQKSWKARLKALGIKQCDFAKRVGIYKPALCQYLNCRREPFATRFQKIEQAIRDLENI
jgi:transcriptional regulator with XRE-family HTH domain